MQPSPFLGLGLTKRGSARRSVDGEHGPHAELGKQVCMRPACEEHGRCDELSHGELCGDFFVMECDGFYHNVRLAITAFPSPRSSEEAQTTEV